MTAILLYLLGGAIAGLLAGLLGIGGGLVIVPFLVLVLPWEGIAPAVVMHMAIGTSLAIIICTSLSSARAHHKRGGVPWPLVQQLLPGIVIGAIVGGVIASFLPSVILRVVFAFFVIFMALKLGFNLQLHQREELPKPMTTSSIAGLIGMLCSMLGMGGGAFIVPFLNSCQVKMINAVSVSSVCAVPIAVIGTLSYLLAGLQSTQLPDWSTGYIYWPAFLGVIITSVSFAPLGAKLAHRLSGRTLQKIFAVFLFIVAIDMLLF